MALYASSDFATRVDVSYNLVLQKDLHSKLPVFKRPIISASSKHERFQRMFGAGMVIKHVRTAAAPATTTAAKQELAIVLLNRMRNTLAKQVTLLDEVRTSDTSCLPDTWTAQRL